MSWRQHAIFVSPSRLVIYSSNEVQTPSDDWACRDNCYEPCGAISQVDQFTNVGETLTLRFFHVRLSDIIMYTGNTAKKVRMEWESSCRSPVNSLNKGQWRGAFIFFFDMGLNKRLSKPSRRRWFETPLRPLQHHCKVIALAVCIQYSQLWIEWRIFCCRWLTRCNFRSQHYIVIDTSFSFLQQGSNWHCQRQCLE